MEKSNNKKIHEEVQQMQAEEAKAQQECRECAAIRAQALKIFDRYDLGGFCPEHGAVRINISELHEAKKREGRQEMIQEVIKHFENSIAELETIQQTGETFGVREGAYNHKNAFSTAILLLKEIEKKELAQAGKDTTNNDKSEG